MACACVNSPKMVQKRSDLIYSTPEQCMCPLKNACFPILYLSKYVNFLQIRFSSRGVSLAGHQM